MPGLPGQHLGINAKITVERCGQFNSELDGSVVSGGSQFQFRHDQLSRGSRTRSRVTITLTGWPGRMVSVGATWSWRWIS